MIQSKDKKMILASPESDVQGDFWEVIFGWYGEASI